MRLRSLASFVVLFVLAAVAPGASATSDGALVLRNVTIVDIERKRLEPRRDLVIIGERIVGIQAGGTARAPRQGRVLDGSGKFLMPGLWDFHVHVFSATGEEGLALPLYIVNGTPASAMRVRFARSPSSSASPPPSSAASASAHASCWRAP